MSNPRPRFRRAALHSPSGRCVPLSPRPVRGDSISDMVAATSALADTTALCAPVTLSVPVRRVATFHLSSLSDLLFTLPALHAIREGFPGARLYAVVRPTLAPLLRESALVDEVLLRPSGGLQEQTALMLQLRARHIDSAIAFSQSRNTTMLAWSSGAVTRVGFAAARLEALLTHRVSWQDAPPIEAYLDLARVLGCAARQHDYRGLVCVPPPAQRSTDRLLAEFGIGEPFIVAACELGQSPPQSATPRPLARPTLSRSALARQALLDHVQQARRGSRTPMSPHSIRQWPAAHWAVTLDELAARLPVVLVGTQPSGQVTSLMQRPVADMGGRLDVAGLAALCGRARLFVGSDGGVMHLAASLGTSVVGIFGPSDWLLTGPRGVPHRIVRHPVECSPCLLSRCQWAGSDERKCLTQLQPHTVVEAVRELIGV